MEGMPKTTVTIFNRKAGDRGRGDTWYPTVIRNAFLQIDRAAVMEKYSTNSQDNAELHIDYTVKDGTVFVQCGDGVEKPYMDQKEWDKTEDSITFANGTNFDFFWKGEWTDGIVSDEEEWLGDEDFYTYMNRKYDHVYAVNLVAQKQLLPHFEIMGK